MIDDNTSEGMIAMAHGTARDGTSVKLRGPRCGDSGPVAELLSKDGVRQGTTALPHASETEADRILRSGDDRHVVVAAVGDCPVGYLTLQWGPGRWRRIASLSMAVHDDYAGRGMGWLLLKSGIEVAFVWLDIRRIELLVYEGNTAAIALYKKAGFEIEGYLRRSTVQGGVYANGYLMALLRDPDDSEPVLAWREWVSKHAPGAAQSATKAD